ncbi:MAG TPA: sporulation protein YqfD [Pseudoneobacillus sp.]|nr:sporulation protein YqfD [Pseudoneobacillus sp.]
MKNQWIEFYSGIVTVKITGKGIERFINSLTRNNLVIWNVKKCGTNTIIFKMKLSDVNELRKHKRGSDCKVKFLQRSGAPFLLKRLFRNSGFLIGAIGFILVIMLLSNMVWGIEIKGAKPATEHQIRKQLTEMGIQVGKLQFYMDDVETIQRKLTNKIEVLTWVGVELKGTTYHFQVVEKNQPKKPEVLNPRNLVAKKKAIIVKMFVENGKSQVKLNDRVVPGQLLISGLIGKEDNPKMVPAKGEILGETWYKTSVDLPLKSNFYVFNGQEKLKHSIKIGKLNIPVWGFGKMKFNEFEKETLEKNIRFLKWNLPITYVLDTYREREKVTREYSKEEAIVMAKNLAREDIKSLLSEDAKIKGEKVLHQSFENGKVKISIHFQVIENIAKSEPITQGDSE